MFAFLAARHACFFTTHPWPQEEVDQLPRVRHQLEVLRRQRTSYSDPYVARLATLKKDRRAAVQAATAFFEALPSLRASGAIKGDVYLNAMEVRVDRDLDERKFKEAAFMIADALPGEWCTASTLSLGWRYAHTPHVVWYGHL